MPDISASIAVLDKFIGLGKEIAKLSTLVLPEYKPCAVDLYRICQRILKSNENLTRWFHRFLYFDFQASNARSEFLKTIQEYKSMKVGPEFQQLKFSCHDIKSIYHHNIASKLGKWFSNQSRLEEAQAIFESLSVADGSMVVFVTEEILGRLDNFVLAVEQSVDNGDLNAAETQRLAFKSNAAQIVQILEHLNAGFAELVMAFAGIAKIPITLGQT